MAALRRGVRGRCHRTFQPESCELRTTWLLDTSPVVLKALDPESNLTSSSLRAARMR